MLRRRVERLRHEAAADAIALPPRLDRDRTDHGQAMTDAVVTGQQDGPALDRAYQRAVFHRGNAERGHCGGGATYLISGTPVTVRAERTVEQRLDGGAIDISQRHESDHGQGSFTPDSGRRRA
jgi:hypothetical protein